MKNQNQKSYLPFKRPSEKELWKKIEQAKTALAKDEINLLFPEVIILELLNFGDFTIDEDLKDILVELLDTVKPENYEGTRPPQKSYESQIENQELFAFVLNSQKLNCAKLYFKFAVKNEVFWLVSLHEDKKIV